MAHDELAEEEDKDRFWTADELMALPPLERDAIVRAGFITDPALVPSRLLKRARQSVRTRIAAAEGGPTQK